MRILGVRLELHLRRHVLCAPPFAADAPGAAAVTRHPSAAARNADDNVLRIAWIDANGVNTRVIRAATEPHFALRVVPQLAIERPRIAGIVRLEQATWHR